MRADPNHGTGEVDDYWDSWPAHQHQHIRRFLRARRFMFDGEPVQKGNRRSRGRALEIRDQVSTELRGHRRAALTGPVALSVHFTVTVDDPPDLTRLAKFLLDVLGRDQTNRHRGPAVYLDDRQVRMLHVSWSHTTGNDHGHTDVVVQPLRDVVAELRLAQQIRHTRPAMTEYASDDDDPLNELADDPLDDELLDDAGLPAELRQWHRRFVREHHQTAVLRRTAVHLRNLLVADPDRITGSRPSSRDQRLASLAPEVWADLQKTNNASWTSALAEPLTVTLPALPTRTGDARRFQEAVTAKIADFVATWPTIAPLEKPLTATVLVVAPRQGKDLDNIALAMLPALHRALRPDASITSAIHAYQVIELRRRDNDPPAGQLRVVLGTTTTWRSDWAHIGAANERQLERLVDQ